MVVFILMCVLALFPVPAFAAPPDVMTIVKQMKEVFESPRPSTRKVEISLRSKGEEVHWVARQARKEFPDGKRILMVMLAPDDVKGTAYMIAEPKTRPTRMWVYMPAIRRVRELAPVDVYEHFLGTDFTYADLGFVRMHENYRFLGEEQHAGVRAYKIEEQVPKERLYYSRIITWVAADSKLPLERDYYDPAGMLWKRELFEEVTVIDGVPTPLRIKMEDLESKSSTELNVSEVRYDQDIPDTLFEPERLPQSASHSLWHTLNAATTTKQ
ncbi:MAG: outer membrane lipoprotein-sorting protein [Candidatus Binatia bacterium]